MQDKKNIIDCYSKTARKYAEKFSDELSLKHFDRIYLNAFADRNKSTGKILDIGCGTGHITKFLFDGGCYNVTGIDLSPGMIEVARNLYPDLCFETGDMLSLPYQDQSIHGAIAMYSIIHFDYEAIEKAFKEVNRILFSKSDFLISFHIGDTILHRDEFLNEEVNIDFHLLNVSKIRDLLTSAGFRMIEIIERYPYPEIEYQSKRAYILASKSEP
jgi:ubiquinone/menaquinone biosynthesis C-methylase UbiE